MGLEWREADRSPPGRDDVGVYRIGDDGHGPLDYLGQGLIASRLSSHAKNWAVDLAAERGGVTVWDWVSLRVSTHQLLEVENDLIASHMMILSRPPVAQFGRR